MAEALAVASGVAGLVGTGLKIGGQVEEYRQQKANAEAQRKLYEYNAKLERREADAALAAADQDAQRQRLEDARLRSAQGAAFGKSGVALSSGSPLALMGQTAAYQEMNVQDIHRKGAEKYGRHMGQYQSLMYQGRIAGANHMSKTSLGMGIAGTLVGTLPGTFAALGGMGGQ